MLTLPIASDAVPESLECVISNSKWQELITLLSVTVVDGFKWNVGNTVPAAEDRIWPWLRLDGSGRPDDIYYYAGGLWLAKHHTAPGTVIMWEGAVGDIDAFDGGETAAITDTAGPFWQRVTEMNGRIPIGPGDIDAGPPLVDIDVNENAGNYDMQLGDENYRHHKHFVASSDSQSGAAPPTSSNQVAYIGGGNAQENYNLQGTGSAANVGLSSNVNADTAANEAFPILPQVRGIWFLRRTARLFRRI